MTPPKEKPKTIYTVKTKLFTSPLGLQGRAEQMVDSLERKGWSIHSYGVGSSTGVFTKTWPAHFTLAGTGTDVEARAAVVDASAELGLGAVLKQTVAEYKEEVVVPTIKEAASAAAVVVGTGLAAYTVWIALAAFGVVFVAWLVSRFSGPSRSS